MKITQFQLKPLAIQKVEVPKDSRILEVIDNSGIRYLVVLESDSSVKEVGHIISIEAYEPMPDEAEILSLKYLGWVDPCFYFLVL